MRSFIYCPKSGSRIVAAMPNECIRVTTWPNGCQHVDGGVLLAWSTATPRQHWRANARNMAAQIVRAVGGVAWDEQGTICMVVPHSNAVEARDLMADAALAAGVHDVPDEHDKRNTARLVLAGCLGFRPGSLADTVRQAVGNIPVDWPLPEYWEKDSEGNKIAQREPTSVAGGLPPASATSYYAGYVADGTWGDATGNIHVPEGTWGVVREDDGYAVVLLEGTEADAEALATSLSEGREKPAARRWMALQAAL